MWSLSPLYLPSSPRTRCYPNLPFSRNDKCISTDELCTRTITRCSGQSSAMQDVEMSVDRIRETFGRKAELSVSAYDTAWMAMVPSRDSPNKPCFPQCLDWIVENQHQNGSWGLLPGHPLLVKDKLSCTMACVLALRKWRLGDQLVQRGLEFVRSNGLAATSTDQLSPIGFDIVFPSMIREAIKVGLNVPFDQVLVDHMISHRNSVIERNQGNVAVLAYVAEGLREPYPWEELKSYQRSNGSVLDSPATTAAALFHNHDDRCFKYLCSVLKEYRNGVPTVSPMDIFVRLRMVDTLEKLGIERFFRQEVQIVLDDAYRCWQQKSEEMFLDVTCCALAFRLLRQHRYAVSSDELERFSNQQQFFDTISIQYTNIITIQELFRASVLKVHQNESPLQKLHDWTSSYLKQQLLDGRILDDKLRKEVEFDLKNINGTLHRIRNRQSIDMYSENDFQILKTAYRCSNFVNGDLLLLSIQDFNKCQALHKAELQQLERWFDESRLNQIQDTREVLHTIYFYVAADLFSPELSEARRAYALICIVATVIDDFFDKCASKEELVNIIDLIKKWEHPLSINNCSSRVEIFYSALWRAINEIGATASIKQGRCIKNDLIRLWVDYSASLMKELDWWINGDIPTMDEYLRVACVTIGFEIAVFPTACLLGPELPKELLHSEEYSSLMKHLSIVGRLLNDLQSYKRETEERKINSVTIQLSQCHGEITLEEAVETLKGMIEKSKIELLRMLLQTKPSQVPTVLKDSLWSSNHLVHFLYSDRDEYTSPKEITQLMKTVMFEPISLPANVG